MKPRFQKKLTARNESVETAEVKVIGERVQVEQNLNKQK